MREAVKIDDLDIQKISYRRTYNLGNYESKTIEIEASVGAGQAPDEVLDALQEWVANKFLEFQNSDKIL